MSQVIRRSLIGFGAGAVLFGGLGLYLNSAIGAPVFSHPGPVAMFGLIGGTIGGLLGPLFRRRDSSSSRY